MKKIFLILIMLFITTAYLPAQTTWKIDGAHSKVLFSVTYMSLTDVTGRFNEFDATLTRTKDDFSDATLNVTIKTNSIDTDNEKRDGHLKSADFLDAEKYQEITFTGTSFKKAGKNKYKITGDLTINGVTKTVALDARYTGKAKDPWGNNRIGFKATTNINRYDYDVKWNKALDAGGWLVGEKVSIILDVQFLETREEK
ncbi:MAG TPA: YceI family protein [Bacteroidota bacterium]|nr:YceI family protein [Bacteroidota bacterium]